MTPTLVPMLSSPPCAAKPFRGPRQTKLYNFYNDRRRRTVGRIDRRVRFRRTHNIIIVYTNGTSVHIIIIIIMK